MDVTDGTDGTLHYLRSILGQLRMLRAIADKHGGPALPGEVLADNIDWLDCYIDRLERGRSKPPTPTPTTAPTSEAEKDTGTV